MFAINTIVRPNANADWEYSVCGNSVLFKAKVIETFDYDTAGNNMKIEVLEHANPYKVGKKYKVDSEFFEEVIPAKGIDNPDEYIWIDGFKATDRNMKCRGHQYNIGMNAYDGNPALGVKGIHFCTDLQHVFRKYAYDFRNRFFLVKAKVKRAEYEYRNPNNTTLVATEVEFVEDMTDSYSVISGYRAFLDAMESAE